MFDFYKIKSKINDWSHDTIADNNRQIELIDAITNILNSITKLWKENPAYIDSEKNLLLHTTSMFNYPNIMSFLEIYNGLDFQKNIQSQVVQGILESEAKINNVKKLAKQCGIEFINEQEFATFYTLLEKYDYLYFLKESIKRTIISQNYITIFNNCQIYNLHKRQNGAYSFIIGQYENIEIILGIDGIKIKMGEEKAILYVENLERIQDELENYRSRIELEQQKRK